MRSNGFADPREVAAAQFRNSGSYGNGGAMRIAPAALYGLNLSDTDFNVRGNNVPRIADIHSVVLQMQLTICFLLIEA